MTTEATRTYKQWLAYYRQQLRDDMERLCVSMGIDPADAPLPPGMHRHPRSPFIPRPRRPDRNQRQ